MANIYKQTYGYRDRKGQTGNVRVYINVSATTGGDSDAGSALGSSLATALNALTNAFPQSQTGPFQMDPQGPSYGGAGDYETVEDKAEFVFTTPGGAFLRYQVPAPKRAIFYADSETIDPANSLVTAFVALMTAGDLDGAYVCTRDGVRSSVYIGGTLLRRRQIRKFNIITRNPAQTGPGL